MVEPAYVMEAFGELRLALGKLGIAVEPSERSHPYFSAVLQPADQRAPRVGVFVVAHAGTYFSWSDDRRYPLTDPRGAAREIMRDLLRIERAANPGVGRHAAGRVERRLHGGLGRRRRRWPG